MVYSYIVNILSFYKILGQYISTQYWILNEWVIMEFNVAAGIFHPFATIWILKYLYVHPNQK